MRSVQRGRADAGLADSGLCGTPIRPSGCAVCGRNEATSPPPPPPLPFFAAYLAILRSACRLGVAWCAQRCASRMPSRFVTCALSCAVGANPANPGGSLACE